MFIGMGWKIFNLVRFRWNLAILAIFGRKLAILQVFILFHQINDFLVLLKILYWVFISYDTSLGIFYCFFTILKLPLLGSGIFFPQIDCYFSYTRVFKVLTLHGICN